jgi:hypothetical protein
MSKAMHILFKRILCDSIDVSSCMSVTAFRHSASASAGLPISDSRGGEAKPAKHQESAKSRDGGVVDMKQRASDGSTEAAKEPFHRSEPVGTMITSDL